MALRFIDSMSHYDGAFSQSSGVPTPSGHILAKWTTNVTLFDIFKIVNGVGRCGDNVMQVARGATTIEGWGPYYTIPGGPGSTSACFGAAFRYVGPLDSACNLFTLFKGGVLYSQIQLALQILTDGTFRLVISSGGNSATAIVNSTTTLALKQNSWHYVELVTTIDPAAGAAQIWLDGVKLIDLSGINTAGTGAAGYTGFALGVVWGGLQASPLLQFNSFYYGDALTDRKGDSRVFVRVPAGDGDLIQWTPLSGLVHFTQVQEIPPDDDVTYNVAPAGGLTDLYTLPPVGIPSGTIFAVQVCPLLKKSDVGPASAAIAIKESGVVYPGTTQAIAGGPAGTYLYYPQIWATNDPAGNPWTVASANGIQVGVTSV